MTLRAVRAGAAVLLLAGLLASAGTAFASPASPCEWYGMGRFEVREVSVGFSESGDACWFSALLESDFGCDGRRSCWRFVRVNGLIERHGGAWRVERVYMAMAADAAMTARGRMAY